MTSAASPDFNTELLDDFFTECDEHLASIRQALVSLEGSIGKAQPEKAPLQNLFHSFHSLKGIAAIVGLRPAEELAHATEEILRDLTKGNLIVTQHGLDLLMSSTQRLEQIVISFRSGESLPDTESVMQRLKEICGPHTANSGLPVAPLPQQVSSSIATYLEEAHSRRLILWKCIFSPTRELDGRGINITTVRARLTQVGEIFYVAPLILGDSRIAFEFYIGMPLTPPDIASWESDGISVELIERAASFGGPALNPANNISAGVSNPFLAPAHVVRVDLDRLDDLMRITGEIVIHRSRFDQEITRAAREGGVMDFRSLQEINTGVSKSLRELRQAIMRVRLVSVAEIFARMPFVVRDLARETTKKVRLTLEGEQTEIDKYLVEQVKDPLLHLVRNAFSHGIETPEERAKNNKPIEATIVLKARAVGDSVIIQVRDDGRGINVRAVMAAAKDIGMDVPRVLDNASILQILCSPGFSTKRSADRVSGRGVGMSVVDNKIRELGGSLSLETQEGRGTQFTMRLPLTLAIADVLIVSAAGQTCAVPQACVVEVFQVTEDQIRTVNSVQVVPFRDGVLPVVRLAGLFALKEGPRPCLCVLALTSDRGLAGLIVEQIHGRKEVVVRAIRDPLAQVLGITGASELGDGRPVLILDSSVLTRGPVRPHDAQPTREFFN